MASLQILALCVVFGGMCAFYVSAVGFVLSALVTVAILTGLTWLAGEASSGWTPAVAFVALQIGYVLGIVGSALAHSLSSTLSKEPRGSRASLHVDHE